MGLQVIGAGLGRTGTMSLKLALERLLGQPCYHMVEVFTRPQDVPLWHGAVKGQMPDWGVMLDGYGAAVDWPAVAFWKELSEAFPDAKLVMSVRDPQSWWESASQTIFDTQNWDGQENDWLSMVREMISTRFTPDITNREGCIDAFEKHYANVRATVPSSRLVEWHPSQGWEPLCTALGVAVPQEPLPHVNTRQDWFDRRAAGHDHRSELVKSGTITQTTKA